MVILSIFRFAFLLFGVDVELRRRIFGFEAGDHRCSPLQARMERENNHPGKKNRLRVFGARRWK
jgi:hypothetical protein